MANIVGVHRKALRSMAAQLGLATVGDAEQLLQRIARHLGVPVANVGRRALALSAAAAIGNRQQEAGGGMVIRLNRAEAAAIRRFYNLDSTADSSAVKARITHRLRHIMSAVSLSRAGDGVRPMSNRQLRKVLARYDRKHEERQRREKEEAAVETVAWIKRQNKPGGVVGDGESDRKLTKAERKFLKQQNAGARRAAERAAAEKKAAENPFGGPFDLLNPFSPAAFAHATGLMGT